MLTQAHLAGIDRYKTIQGTIRADTPLVSFKRLRYSSCSKYCRVAMYDETGTPCSSLAGVYGRNQQDRCNPPTWLMIPLGFHMKNREHLRSAWNLLSSVIPWSMYIQYIGWYSWFKPAINVEPREFFPLGLNPHSFYDWTSWNPLHMMVQYCWTMLNHH